MLKYFIMKMKQMKSVQYTGWHQSISYKISHITVLDPLKNQSFKERDLK